MSQSMNGLSLFSGNGISESDNIACNNLSANLINSNAILTDNLNATQTTGALATFSGLVTVNKLIAGNVHADTRIDCDLFECRRLNSYEVIEGNQITMNRLNCNINGVFAAIDCAANVACTKVIFKDSTGDEVLDSIIVSNLFGLTSNVQKFINRISRDSLGSLTTGFNNLGLGQFALAQLTTGTTNIAVGQDSSYGLFSGSNNISVGTNSGLNNIDGINNICIGTNTGQATDPSGISYRNSVAIGANVKYDASNQIVLGTVNETVIVKGAFVCDSSISALSLELSNQVFTSAILSNILNLTSNVQDQFDKLSKDSGLNVTTGVRNIALGEFTLAANTTGSYNIGIGEQCLNDVVTGNNNIAIGKYAGGSLISSSDCICIGTETDQGTVGNFFNSVAIGYRAKFNASNQIVLGDSTHRIKIAGKVECNDIITKSKMKYGRYRATSNNTTTVYYAEAFPETGPLPYVQLTPIYSGVANISSSLLFLVDYYYTYFSYEFLSNGVHAESIVDINWMAMVN